VYAEALGLDEAAVVWTTDGVPQRFEWRGKRFIVGAKPTLWYDHVPWWRTSAHAPKGGGGGDLLEQRKWQVSAFEAETGEVVRVDLAVGVDPSWWRVTRVYE
jgi:hypothetical protein